MLAESKSSSVTDMAIDWWRAHHGPGRRSAERQAETQACLRDAVRGLIYGTKNGKPKASALRAVTRKFNAAQAEAKEKLDAKAKRVRSETTRTGKSNGTSKRVAPKRSRRQVSIADQLKSMFRSDPSATLTVRAILDTMKDVDPRSVRGILGKLSREKDGVRRASRGMYKFHGRKKQEKKGK